jgi:4-hydroxy-tetrahydrodipicolinate synthase
MTGQPAVDLKGLGGVIPPMITPFDDRDRIDSEGLAHEARFLRQSGVNGIVVGGSMGEGAGMSPAELGQAVRVVVEALDGSIPILAALIADSSIEAIRLGKVAREAGAVGLQVPPPNFYSSNENRVLAQYYLSITEAVGLPLIIYNVIPWAQLAVESLAQLVSDNPAIIGIKQSGRNMQALSALLANFRGRLRIYSAIDDLIFPSFVLGVDGTISGTACVFPRETVAMRAAVERGDIDGARQLHERLAPIWRLIDMPDFPSRAKYAIALTGRPAGNPRRPFRWPEGEAARSIERAMRERGLANGNAMLPSSLLETHPTQCRS